MENTFLSVIIPAYNEEARIKNTLEKIHSYLKNQDYTYEIIIVNDGSTDNTWALVNEIAQKIKEVRILKNEKNRGKGFTIKKGFLNAKGKYLLFTDADLSTPIEEVEKLISWLKKGYDIAIGSRALKESHIQIHQPWYRELAGRIFNLFV
ncbi:MAG: glycosyltransferase, partial [Candidatus Desulfofervidus auxilii]|nr:glycosyltransferase [Candidatus Desulfofervidus auxilii]